MKNFINMAVFNRINMVHNNEAKNLSMMTLLSMHGWIIIESQ